MLYYILLYTWGLLMSSIGLIASLFLLLLGYKPKKHKRCWYFELEEDWGGISLGCCFIILTNHSDYLLDHEYGHTILNALYGPLFIILVAIPSFVRCLLWDFNDDTKDYYDIWFEKQASEWGEKC